MRAWATMCRALATLVLATACVHGHPEPAGTATPQGCHPLARRRPPTPGDDQIELPYLEYLARTPEHEWLLVVRPSLMHPQTAIRVFFGPSAAVREMTLVDFGRQRDGGTTDVRFSDGARTIEAFFPVRCSGPPLEPKSILGSRRDCVGTLTVDGVERPLQRFELAPPDDLTFECRTPVDFRV